MAIVIDGTGSITGLSAGGLPDGSITASDLASSLDLSAKTVTLPAGVGGKVLQLKTIFGASEYSFSNGAWRDLTSFNVSITPSSTSSKIYIIVTLNGGSGGNNFYGHGRVLRGSTPIGLGNSSGNAQLQAGFSIAMEAGYTKQGNFSYSFLDSPSTTFATTYKVQVYPHNQTFTWNRVGEVSSEVGYARTSSSLTVMEIAE